MVKIQTSAVHRSQFYAAREEKEKEQEKEMKI